MSERFVEASDGVMLDLEKLPSTLTYNANRTLASESVVHPNGKTYTVSFTYDANGMLVSTTQWVKQ